MAKRATGPATLAVVQAVRAVGAGRRLVIGCSGGADSLVLVAAAALALGADRVRACVVDHGLQADSGEVAAAAAAACRCLGVAAEVVSVRCRDDGSGLEAAAREARYQALFSSLRDGEWLAVGHTLDDQAETVLLGLLRGSGTRSLSGMAAVSGRLLRPLLGLRADTIRQAADELALAVWVDPHNHDERFRRVQIRQRVLPGLVDELGTGIVEALGRTAALARADADCLDDFAAKATADSPVVDPLVCPLTCAELARHPQAIRSRVLRAWLVAAGVREPSFEQVQQVCALATAWRGQGPVSVPGASVVREDGYLRCVLG